MGFFKSEIIAEKLLKKASVESIFLFRWINQLRLKKNLKKSCTMWK